jgi:hypothetical protein
MVTAGLRVPTKQIINFSNFTVSDVSRLQQGASRLQTSANPWTFPMNTTSPLRIHFPLLNPTDLRHYRITCITYCLELNFSLVLSLALV